MPLPCRSVTVSHSVLGAGSLHVSIRAALDVQVMVNYLGLGIRGCHDASRYINELVRFVL
jgi:hypothetical protein